MEDWISNVYKEKFDINIVSYKEISDGHNFSSYRVEDERNCTYFMKTCQEGTGGSSVSELKNEVHILSVLNSNGVSNIPPVHSSWFSNDKGMLILEWLDGYRFGDCDFSNNLGSSIGAALSNIHNVPVDDNCFSVGRYGEEGLGLVDEVEEAISWTMYMEYFDVVDVCRSVLEETEPAVGFTHGDFHPPNILFTSDGIRVLDFEYGGVSDRHIDLAKASVRFFKLYRQAYEEQDINVEELLDQFWSSYTAVTDVNKERLWAYEVLFVLRELGLVDKYGPPETWKRTSKVSTDTVGTGVLDDLLENRI